MTAAMTLLATTGVSVGALIELLALAVGAGAGVGLGVQLARKRRMLRAAIPEGVKAGEDAAPSIEAAPVEAPPTGPSAPVWQPQPQAMSGTATTVGLLFATAVGFALIGFFCGSLSGTVVLVALEGVRFLASGIVITLANLITGIVAGFVAGYLVEAFGRRWQLVDEELGNPRQRTALIALAVGVVMGGLLGVFDDLGLGGAILAMIGISAVSVAMSIAVLEAPAIGFGSARGESK